MKITRFTALLLCAAMTLGAASGCKKHTSSSSETTSRPGGTVVSGSDNLGTNKIPAKIAEEVSGNDTKFKLNSIVETEVIPDKNKKYIYLNVDISNDTDTDYKLTSLNNTWLRMADDTIIGSSLMTRYYALSIMKEDAFIVDPFIVPAHGSVSGFITGFEVDPDFDSCTVEFFPTKNSINDKETVVQVEVKPGDITKIPDEYKK